MANEILFSLAIREKGNDAWHEINSAIREVPSIESLKRAWLGYNFEFKIQQYEKVVISERVYT